MPDVRTKRRSRRPRDRSSTGGGVRSDEQECGSCSDVRVPAPVRAISVGRDDLWRGVGAAAQEQTPNLRVHRQANNGRDTDADGDVEEGVAGVERRRDIVVLAVDGVAVVVVVVAHGVVETTGQPAVAATTLAASRKDHAATEARISSRSRTTSFVVRCAGRADLLCDILCLCRRCAPLLSLESCFLEISNTKDISRIHKRFSGSTKKARMVSRSGLPKNECVTLQRS